MPFKIITALLAFSFLTESLSPVFYNMLGTPRPVYHIYTPVSLILYSIFFYLVIGKNRFLQIFLKAIIISAVPASLINTYYLQNLLEFPSNVVLPGFILLSLFSIILLYYLIRFPEELPILKNPLFWFAAGTLIFQTASFIYLGFPNIVTGRLSSEGKTLISQIHLFFAMFMYAMYGLAMSMDSVRPKNIS